MPTGPQLLHIQQNIGLQKLLTHANSSLCLQGGGVLSLRASSLGCSGGGGRQGRKRMDFHQSAQSGNKHECKQTLKTMWKMELTSSLMSSQPISISHQLFQCRYPNSRDVVASSPSFSCPTARAPWRAYSQARGFPTPPGQGCQKDFK